MQDIVKNMEALARKWHEGAFRKGPGNVPYIVHPEAVVEKLRGWGYNDREDAVTLAVAWGHDLLEDTKCPAEEILAAGGEAVLAGIKSLTFVLPKQPRLSKAARDAKKNEYIQNVAKTASPEILVVKMADRLCNTMDFVRANNKWGDEYLRLGECLFERVREVKYSARIEPEVDIVFGLADDLASGAFDNESYDERCEREQDWVDTILAKLGR